MHSLTKSRVTEQFESFKKCEHTMTEEKILLRSKIN